MRASRGEIKIHEILEANDINFKEEYEFAGLKAPNNHVVYVHINKINNKVYVGQTNNPKERWRPHGKLGRYGDSPLFKKAIDKYGWDNFYHLILESNLTQEEANEREQYWIKTFDSFNSDNGYNLTPGGDNYMSQLWQDQEYKDRMSKSFSERGKRLWSDERFAAEAQKKMQEGVQRFWNDPVKRAKRIEEITGSKNPNSKAVRNIETGKVFDTIKDAAKWAGLKSVSTIGQNCRGEKKSAGKHPDTGEKLHWKYCIVTGGDAE